MKIVYEYPPNIEKIKKILNPHRETVFTYGDTIYAPSMKGKKLSEYLLIHEVVHMKQQVTITKDIDEWWDRYLEDAVFRLEQELEAYTQQFKSYKQRNKQWMPFLRSIAEDLSGPMYGNIITFQEAWNRILA